MNLRPPESGEYAPYYGRYISLVPGEDIVRELESQHVQTMELLAGHTDREGDFRYAPDKWSLNQVVGHITDTERIFAYRALRIGRGDQTPIEGFEQDDYARDASFNQRSLADLAAEFSAVREATLALFRSLAEEAWSRRGIASKNEVSVRALAYIIAGHELHHRKILQERYFSPIRPA
ncbi:MAG TPA: DinB family protein [Candidatus Acidoferrum sp.]|nr:DinB family protein [Candidatus Acidoferrum sp.]